jgi:hypothetical protein
VRCLAATCGHLRKRSLLAAAGKVAPLLRHHSAAVRHSAVAFIAAAARALPPADVYTQLAVMVAPLLQQQPLILTGVGCGLHFSVLRKGLFCTAYHCKIWLHAAAPVTCVRLGCLVLTHVMGELSLVSPAWLHFKCCCVLC